MHGIHISKRTLERILRRFRLRRHRRENNLIDIVRNISFLHDNGYGDWGYKSIWKLLNTGMNIRANQETVRLILQTIDPEGVEVRSRRRLRRRQYINKGPGYLIHLDGYDKLKPFGFSIHGAIDGFSRRILWLKVMPSNKNPRVIGNLFVKFLQEIGRVPRMVRCDAGTENVLIRDIQMTLRSFHNDSISGYNSFSVGRSTGNQRIEMIWSFLMKGFTQYWRNKFKDMQDANQLDNTNEIHIQCLRFSFLNVIQEHLDTYSQSWNLHRIRSQRNSESFTDIPDVMFFQPLAFGASDCWFDIPCHASILEDIKRDYTEEIPERGCAEEFLRAIEISLGMNRNQCPLATSPDEAKEMYLLLIRMFQRFL